MRSPSSRFFAVLAVLVLASAAWAGEGQSYLGVDVDDVTADRVQALKLKSEAGVEITMVDNDAPAGKAGLKEHDVILQFNGQGVGSVEQLRRMIRETPPGRTVQLTISRDGNQQNLSVTLADKKMVYKTWVQPRIVMPRTPRAPDAPRMIEIPEIYVTTTSTSRVGLVLEPLTTQLGEFFGVKNGEGLLVRSVEKGSPAESAGFKAGDVIVKVEQEPVGDRGDWRSALRNKSGKVPVGIVRDKREQTLTLTLPDKKQSSNRNRIVLPDFDLDLDFDFDELAAIGPEAMELAMLKAKVEWDKNKDQVKKEMSKAKTKLKQDMQKQKQELKRQQEELKQQHKELKEKQLREPDDDNE
ncbi:MAG TPA: PDZ domain-containing protein [Terriglobales bacterium]|nr:PDZ domain-containing protein [Terriglobales bacterium]